MHTAANHLTVVQSPVATKADEDSNEPEGSGPAGDGPDSSSSETTPAPPQPQAWNPFKSRAKVPVPPEPVPSEEDGDGGKRPKPAKHGRPFVAVPSDHEILTSLPSDKIWGNMQQHASEGMHPFADLATAPVTEWSSFYIVHHLIDTITRNTELLGKDAEENAPFGLFWPPVLAQSCHIVHHSGTAQVSQPHNDV